MTIRFVEEAQREIFEAISYYEEARGGLGRRFKDEVESCVLWIADHPELYYIAYVIREQTLWVLAAAHGSRKPHYWISRRNEVPGT